MSFYTNRLLVEQNMQKGSLDDCQIADCDISSLEVNKRIWTEVELRDTRANDIAFSHAELKKCRFFRSDLVRMSFSSSTMRNVTLDGLTLIRSVWQKSALHEITLRNACLQRAKFQKVKVFLSSFTDFEAIESRMENCLFAHSRFVITYGNGMNGYSGAILRNCIFYNCRFEGFPLRGATLENCVFVQCYGEVGDDMDCRNVAGLHRWGDGRSVRLKRPAQAAELLARFA